MLFLRRLMQTQLRYFVLAIVLCIATTLYFFCMDFPDVHQSSSPFECSPIDLSKYLQTSLNRPLGPIEVQSLRYVPELRNPCWYETFDEDDLSMMMSNPYQFPFKGAKIFNKSHSFLDRMTGFVGHYSAMLAANDNARLRCLPYFYIIGQPKCASSDFYITVNRHPQIEGGLVKESQWWAWTSQGVLNGSDAGKGSSSVPLELSDWADLFSSVSIDWQQRMTKDQCQQMSTDICHQRIISDGSVYTLDMAHVYQETGTRRGMVLDKPMTTPVYLKWLIPMAKLILLAREPGDRLYSAYKYFRGKEQRKRPNDTDRVVTSPLNFHEEVVKYIRAFDKCLKVMPAHSCRYTKDLRRGQDMLVTDSLYIIYLEEWMKIFGPDDILVIRTEDYQNDRMATLRKTFRFLGVCDPSANVEMQLANFTTTNKGRINVGPMLDKTRRLLNKFFRPYNQRLAGLLNDRRFLWEDYL